jgi:hypothetical protein
MWAKPTLYRVLKVQFWHSVFPEFNQDSKYAIEIALSLILREILAISGPYPPPQNLPFSTRMHFRGIRLCSMGCSSDSDECNYMKVDIHSPLKVL